MAKYLLVQSERAQTLTAAKDFVETVPKERWGDIWEAFHDLATGKVGHIALADIPPYAKITALELDAATVATLADRGQLLNPEWEDETKLLAVEDIPTDGKARYLYVCGTDENADYGALDFTQQYHGDIKGLWNTIHSDGQGVWDNDELGIPDDVEAEAFFLDEETYDIVHSRLLVDEDVEKGRIFIKVD